jgi:hypothetical protein
LEGGERSAAPRVGGGGLRSEERARRALLRVIARLTKVPHPRQSGKGLKARLSKVPQCTHGHRAAESHRPALQGTPPKGTGPARMARLTPPFFVLQSRPVRVVPCVPSRPVSAAGRPGPNNELYSFMQSRTV